MFEHRSDHAVPLGLEGRVAPIGITEVEHDAVRARVNHPHSTSSCRELSARGVVTKSA